MCQLPSYEEAYIKSDLVFEGKVVDAYVDNDDKLPKRINKVKVTFKLLKIWKGKADDLIEVSTFVEKEDAWSRIFQKNESRILFVEKKGNEMVFPLCGLMYYSDSNKASQIRNELSNTNS